MKKNKFDKMCEAYYEKVYRYVWVSTGSKEQACDITQEVFLIAYEKGQDFLKHEKPLAFLYTTARNLIYELHRENKKCIAMEIHESALVSQEEDLAEYIHKQADKEIEVEPYAKEIIENLSEDKQKLYQLYYVEQKPRQGRQGAYNSKIAHAFAGRTGSPRNHRLDNRNRLLAYIHRG